MRGPDLRPSLCESGRSPRLGAGKLARARSPSSSIPRELEARDEKRVNHELAVLGHQQGLPWRTVLLVAAVFFIADHDLFVSLHEWFISATGIIVDQAREGSLQRRAAFSVLGFFGAVGLMRRGQHRLTLNGILAWLILFFVAWASLSVTWAEDIAFTLRRTTVFWFLCLGALAVGKHLSVRDVILCVFYTTGLYVLIGVGCELILHTFHPFAPGYRFAGTEQPNAQGMNCVLLALTALAMSRLSRRKSWFFLLCTLAALACLVLSGSRAALAGGIAGLVVYWALMLPRYVKIAWLLGVSAVICLLALVAGDSLATGLGHGALLGRTDADLPSLAGRIPLWKDILSYAAERPLHGYGYNGFLTPSRIAEIATTQRWGFFQVHSAYLELLLGIGLIGVTSFVLILALAMRESARRYRVSLNPAYACLAAILAFSLIQGVLESMVVSSTLLSFVVLVVLAHVAFAVPHDGHRPVLSGATDACLLGAR